MQTFQGAIICLAFIIGGSGFHNNAIAVNPSDLAPKHSGSVFGLMNTVGAIPGTEKPFIFCFTSRENDNVSF